MADAGDRSRRSFLADLEQDTLERLAGFIREVIGEEWADDIEIEARTSFNSDLELESIEFVALAEKLQEHYGKRVDFVGWLSGKDINEIIQLTVGDLVTFIVSCLSSGSTA
jgi:acyl carrier protein